MTRESSGPDSAHPADALRRAPGDLAIDPVCGQVVDPVTVRHRRRYQGSTYHFCCAGCQAHFDAHPAAYHQGRGHTPNA